LAPPPLLARTLATAAARLYLSTAPWLGAEEEAEEGAEEEEEGPEEEEEGAEEEPPPALLRLPLPQTSELLRSAATDVTLPAMLPERLTGCCCCHCCR
jgi:hypothetical protein